MRILRLLLTLASSNALISILIALLTRLIVRLDDLRDKHVLHTRQRTLADGLLTYETTLKAQMMHLLVAVEEASVTTHHTEERQRHQRHHILAVLWVRFHHGLHRPMHVLW